MNKFLLLALLLLLNFQLAFSEKTSDSPGKTYAVILNGGKSLDGNKENYWNDCSFFYMTLRNVYDVPRENIKVLMADGTDPSVDMKLEGNETLYISSPLDLDDDGIDDIEYSATRDNLKNVFADLSNVVTPNDHLLVFVIDHGSVNRAGISQICLWGDSISAPELSDMVKPLDVGYMTFVLGQCYAGGFEKYLRADSRLILTACREYEKSYCREEELYDEFVYQFTSALAGYTPYDEPVDADYNGDGTVSIVEAYRYAEENDGYNDGDFSFGSIREHPSISYLIGSNAAVLSALRQRRHGQPDSDGDVRRERRQGRGVQAEISRIDIPLKG